MIMYTVYYIVYILFSDCTRLKHPFNDPWIERCRVPLSVPFLGWSHRQEAEKRFREVAEAYEVRLGLVNVPFWEDWTSPEIVAI